jgi:hypothetical protein
MVVVVTASTLSTPSNLELACAQPPSGWVQYSAVKMNVRRRHRRAVGPHDAIFELPGDRGQVSAMPPFSTVGISVDEPGNHLAGLVEAGQRLDDQRGRFDVLGAAREIRVQDRGRLPVDDLDLAVRASLGVCDRCDRHGGDGTHQNSSQFHGCLLVDFFQFVISPAVGSAVVVMFSE